MADLTEGLYEAVLTAELRDSLAKVKDALLPSQAALHLDESSLVLATYLHDRIRRALTALPAEDKLEKQVKLTNAVLEILSEGSPKSGIDQTDLISTPHELLRALTRVSQNLAEARPPRRPNIPLSASDIIVNGPHDLDVGGEIRREIESADEIDFVVSFLKFSGVRIITDALRSFLERRPGGLRVLTTTYTGATELRALEALREIGARIKVSYNNERTRLHAKAWSFHRASGFSTAIVGSSNLSRAALLDGAEWNIRVSNVANPEIIEKLRAVFEQYWSDVEFRHYHPDEFEEAIVAQKRKCASRLLKFDIAPKPHQQEILDALAREREHGHWHNLVVSATGTGKTVVAALDYRRLKEEHGLNSLLFVAHRKEILEQSMDTFQVVLRDGGFGEMLHGGNNPREGKHVFATIQSLGKARLEKLSPKAYDVVIVDEFHHAAAETYDRLLEHLKPRVLLGLTATPERADGRNILGWFDDRVAAEIRLWKALDRGLLVPFQYFGIHDGTDLSTVDWRNGRYDADALTKIYTAEHFWTRRVIQETRAKVSDVTKMRALGFCCTIKHAEFMAQQFSEAGIAARAVSGRTPWRDRDAAVRALEQGEIQVLFTVDLFNEGLDVPDVDTVLFLRPTESATIFLQQLGRGLRLTREKSCLTVLDFIGSAHRKFRFDLKYRAIVGGTRRSVMRAIEEGFPRLPAGCALQLDRHAQEAVLRNIQQALNLGYKALQEDLRSLGRDVTLKDFLRQAEADLDEVYTGKHYWTELRRKVGLETRPPSATEAEVGKALGASLHLDDSLRLETFRGWLEQDEPPKIAPPDTREGRIQAMLHVMLGHRKRPLFEMQKAFEELWASDPMRREILEVLDLLDDRTRRPTYPYEDLGVPLRVHGTYKRAEIMAAFGDTRNDKVLIPQGGVYYQKDHATDLLFVTIHKSEKDFTPTTRYNDYPMTPSLFHWESQGVVREASATGQRYIHHEARGSKILLFVREKQKSDRGERAPYVFLGPASYVRHESERPMQIVWRLHRPMPADFFQLVKVAAG